MEPRAARRFALPVGALVLIALGLLLFADQRGWLDFSATLATWWPVFLLLVGLGQLGADRRAWLPWLLIGLGTVFLLGNVGILGAEALRMFWPLALVAAGALLLVRARGGRTKG